MLRTREIQKARDQGIGAVHFGGDVAGHFPGDFVFLATLRASISADVFMVPIGLRSSCARPAVNCPSAATRSVRRTCASASFRFAIGARDRLGNGLRLLRRLLILTREFVREVPDHRQEDRAQHELRNLIGGDVLVRVQKKKE